VEGRSQQGTGQPVLLINPRSFRASRWGLARRAARAARRAGIEVIGASDPARFRAAFDRLRERRVQQVWLLCGDGTIHWIAEYLAGLTDGWSPTLLLLGGGRANVVPRECRGYPAMRALRSALAAHRQGQALPTMHLVTLRLTQAGAPVRHGFFLAGGMVHEGVRVCSEHRARGTGWLHRSLVADFYALLNLLFKVWTGRTPLPPYTHMSVRLAGGPSLEQAPMRILLAGTLGMREALYNPFAATGEGPVRVTAIAATAPHFWRRLPGILRGRFHPELVPANGVLSGRCASATITGIEAYSIDGESFTADPAQPLELAPGIGITVLRP
jgi:hypothetical protein